MQFYSILLGIFILFFDMECREQNFLPDADPDQLKYAGLLIALQA